MKNIFTGVYIVPYSPPPMGGGMILAEGKLFKSTKRRKKRQKEKRREKRRRKKKKERKKKEKREKRKKEGKKGRKKCIVPEGKTCYRMK